MSTRSLIAVAESRGRYRSIYCHDGGSIHDNGILLKNHWSNVGKLEQLMGGGNLSFLGRELGEPFNAELFRKDHEVPEQDENGLWDLRTAARRGWCCFHTRDYPRRSKIKDQGFSHKETRALMHKNLAAFLEYQGDAEYTYVFTKDGRWKVHRIEWDHRRDTVIVPKNGLDDFWDINLESIWKEVSDGSFRASAWVPIMERASEQLPEPLPADWEEKRRIARARQVSDAIEEMNQYHFESRKAINEKRARGYLRNGRPPEFRPKSPQNIAESVVSVVGYDPADAEVRSDVARGAYRAWRLKTDHLDECLRLVDSVAAEKRAEWEQLCREVDEQKKLAKRAAERQLTQAVQAAVPATGSYRDERVLELS